MQVRRRKINTEFNLKRVLESEVRPGRWPVRAEPHAGGFFLDAGTLFRSHRCLAAKLWFAAPPSPANQS